VLLGFVAFCSVLGAQACNARFDFDTTSAGSGGSGGTGAVAGVAAGTAGVAAGTAGVAAGTAGVAAGTAGVAAGAAGAAAGAAGMSATGGDCGTHAQCPTNLHCVEGECYECAEDADCKNAGVARCDESHRCVACLGSTDCKSGYTCDFSNRCLPSCKTKADCPVGAHGCDDDRLVCYQCDDDNECRTSTLGPRCASDGSSCVQCRGDADCTGQHCDALTGRCVECRDFRDCASGLCDPTNGVCVVL
jgi:hypothetical protein